MADSFFGFNTSLSNLNDDEGGGDGSEEEYDALNDETFGYGNDEFDWEVQHEQLAYQLESSRREPGIDDIANEQLEASLSQLVLDETDAPHHTLGSSVWRHEPVQLPTQPLKNVCTVEELERQLRQKQQQPPFNNQNFFQPRFPVILQRPPGLQGPVPLPFAPQQQMNQMSQPLNKIMTQNAQMGQNNQMMNHVNQIGQNVNPLGQNVNQLGQNMTQLGQNLQMNQNVNQFMQHSQMGQFQNNHAPNNMMMAQNMHQPNQMMMNQNMNQHGQNVNPLGQNVNHMQQNINQMAPNLNHIGQPNQIVQNQMGQSVNQMGQNVNPLGQNVNQLGQNVNPLGQNLNQPGQNVNPLGQNVNQLGQNVNQLGQNVNPLGQNVNQMGQNVNHNLMPNGNQFPMNQFHMMGQNRMMVPPPGMNMPRQNFSPNMGQFNHNFRGPIPKPNEQPNMIFKNQQVMQTNQNNQNQNQLGQNMNPIGQNVNQIGQNMNQVPQNMNQIGQNMNQIPQNVNQIGQNMNQIPQNVNQIGQNMNQVPQSVNHIGQNMNQIGQNMNQMHQNVNPNMNLSPKGVKTEKKQQTRIYNNSKLQNNLTSQNLVQIIQNTHPMLQFNSGFHNANHHPLLNRTQYSNVNHPMLNQRHNGSYSSMSNNISILNGSDDGSDCDEYAGLMTQREKQWLINIQMLQLNTGTPYIHDFYYTVFLERQAQKEKEGVKEAHKANQQNHPFYSGGVKQETLRRERHNSGRHNSTSEDPPRTYVPTQFENSLGKLQCGSVTAPRKIIDVELVGNEAQPSTRPSRAPSVASTTTAEVPRELKRTKQLLLDIEALYLILLRLEELNDPLAISNALILKEREEKQKQLEALQKDLDEQEDESNVFLKNIESVQRRPKQDSPKSETIDKRQVVNLAVPQKPVPVKNLLDEDKDDLVNKMFIGLLHGDRLMQMLTVRKGRSLIRRFVSRVCGSHSRLRPLWCRVLRSAPSLARRHDTGSIAALAPYYTKYIENSTGWPAVLESCALFTEALDPARTPYILTTAFTLTCVCALIEKASTLITTVDATANERQWFRFLKTLARALKNTNLTVARPLNPLKETKLTIHLKQLDSRSSIEILQRGKPAEFADLTKTDIHEQLVKHLCL